jgi:hypothetical protein
MSENDEVSLPRGLERVYHSLLVMNFLFSLSHQA